MNLRYLRISALLILALPLACYAQSLGDVARELRSERQQSGTPPAKVITNDDIVSRKPASERKAAKNKTDKEDETEANSAAGAKQETESAGEAEHAKSGSKTAQDPAKEREARELELDKRSEELNKVYRDRIAGIRAQISAAQQELARLERDQVESSNDFQRSAGTAPNIGTYEAQQRFFNDQIATQRSAITTLNSQLDDAEEAARHAGVPHASE
jgi:chromosome segregation ATPase